jgi:hypothetical protein
VYAWNCPVSGPPPTGKGFCSHTAGLELMICSSDDVMARFFDCICKEIVKTKPSNPN